MGPFDAFDGRRSFRVQVMPRTFAEGEEMLLPRLRRAMRRQGYTYVTYAENRDFWHSELSIARAQSLGYSHDYWQALRGAARAIKYGVMVRSAASLAVAGLAGAALMSVKDPEAVMTMARFTGVIGAFAVVAVATRGTSATVHAVSIDRMAEIHQTHCADHTILGPRSLA